MRAGIHFRLAFVFTAARIMQPMMPRLPMVGIEILTPLASGFPHVFAHVLRLNELARLPRAFQIGTQTAIYGS